MGDSRQKAIVVIGLAQDSNLRLPEMIESFQVHSVLFCEEARLPKHDLRLCVFTVVAPYSPNFNRKKDAFEFIIEIREQHPACEAWLCTEHDIDPCDPCLDGYDISAVVKIGELKERLFNWVRS